MTVRAWITSPREWGEWGMRANAWFNEVANTLRDVVISAADNATAYANHVNNADWSRSGLTFQRGTTNSGTRISDEYSATTEKYVGGTRSQFLSSTAKVDYADDGSTEILVIDRGDENVEIRVDPQQASVAFTSGVVNADTSNAFLGAYLDADGFVHLQGRIANVSGATFTSGSTVFTLPIGYRPARNHSFLGYTPTGYKSALLVVQSDGACRLFHVGAAGTGWINGNTFNLGGFTYYVGH